MAADSIQSAIAERLRTVDDPEQFLDALAAAAGDSGDLQAALGILDLVGTPQQYAKQQQAIQTGERGGRFYLDDAGNKVYVGGGSGGSGSSGGAQQPVGGQQPAGQQQIRVPSAKGSQRLSIGGKNYEPGQPIDPGDWEKATKAERQAFHDLTGRLKKEERKGRKFDIAAAAQDAERLQGQLEKGEITPDAFKDGMEEHVQAMIEELGPKQAQSIAAFAKSYVHDNAANLTANMNRIAYDWMMSTALNEINPQQPMLSTKIWLATQVAAKLLMKLRSSVQVLARHDSSDHATAEEAKNLHAFLEGLKQATGIQSEVPSAAELEEELADRAGDDDVIDAAGEVERTLFDHEDEPQQYAANKAGKEGRDSSNRNHRNAAMLAGLLGGYGMKDWAFVPSGDGKYQRVRVVTLQDKDGNAVKGAEKYEKVIVVDDRAAAKHDLYFHCCAGDFWLSEAVPVPPGEGPDGLLRIIREAERKMDADDDGRDPMTSPVQVLDGQVIKVDDRTKSKKYAATEDRRPFDRTAEIVSQNQALAQQYADHWQQLDQAGLEVPPEETEAVADELEGSGWAVNYSAAKGWQGEKTASSFFGGVTVARRYCRHGEWSEEPIRYAAEDWTEETGPRSGKPRWKNNKTGRIVYKDPTQGKQQRQDERAGRQVDKQGLQERLKPHAEKHGGSLKAGEIKKLDKSFKALQRIHGKGLVARLDEMASQTEKAMGKIKDDPLVKDSMSRRLAGINHLLQKAGGAGGEQAPASAAEQPPAPEAQQPSPQQGEEAGKEPQSEQQKALQAAYTEFSKGISEALQNLKSATPDKTPEIVQSIMKMVTDFIDKIGEFLKDPAAAIEGVKKALFHDPTASEKNPLEKAGLYSKVTGSVKPLAEEDVQKLTEAYGGDKMKALAEMAAMRPDGYWGNREPGGQPYFRPGPNHAVDNVITRDGANGKEVLMIQRGPKGAEAGKWALPGGFHDSDWTDESLADAGLTRDKLKDLPHNGKPWPDGDQPPKGQMWTPGRETAEDAALRELVEETGLDASTLKASMKHVGKFEGGGRDPRDNPEAWASSNAFALHLSPELAQKAVAGRDDASDAKWVPVSELGKMPLAFDHGKILEAAQGGGGQQQAPVGGGSPVNLRPELDAALPGHVAEQLKGRIAASQAAGGKSVELRKPGGAQPAGPAKGGEPAPQQQADVAAKTVAAHNPQTGAKSGFDAIKSAGLEEHIKSGKPLSPEQTEHLSDLIHQDWMKREEEPPGSGEARRPEKQHLMRPYGELPESEKAKDRKFAVQTADELKKQGAAATGQPEAAKPELAGSPLPKAASKPGLASGPVAQPGTPAALVDEISEPPTTSPRANKPKGRAPARPKAPPKKPATKPRAAKPAPSTPQPATTAPTGTQPAPAKAGDMAATAPKNKYGGSRQREIAEAKTLGEKIHAASGVDTDVLDDAYSDKTSGLHTNEALRQLDAQYPALKRQAEQWGLEKSDIEKVNGAMDAVKLQTQRAIAGLRKIGKTSEADWYEQHGLPMIEDARKDLLTTKAAPRQRFAKDAGPPRLATGPLTPPRTKTVMLGNGGTQLHGSFSQNGHAVKV